MTRKSSLLQGLQNYQQHDYLSALKHFNHLRSQPQQEFQTLVNQTLTAVSNIQLCNYNQAAGILNQVKIVIDQYQNQGGTIIGEMEILKAKVLTNFLILEILSCSDKVSQVLQELLNTMTNSISKDWKIGVALFRTVVKSLFGFQSFKMLEQYHGQIVKMVGKSGAKNKQNLPQSVVLSAFAMYSHISGNLPHSLLIEQSAYQISKHKQIIPSLLSLKHLEDLSKEMKDLKSSRNYRNQLKLLMSSEELQGVAQETLFRNYNRKIQLSTQVISALIEKQNEWNINQNFSDGLEKVAVISRLKKIARSQQNQHIRTVLGLLQSNDDILRLMGNSQFVKQSQRQYINNIRLLTERMSKSLRSMTFKILVANTPKPVQIVQRKEVIINLIDEFKRSQPDDEVFLNIKPPVVKKSPQRQQQKQNTAYTQQSHSRKKKQTYATSLHLPKHQILNRSFDHQQPSQRQPKDSRITTTHHYKNKVYKQNTYQHQVHSSNVVHTPHENVNYPTHASQIEQSKSNHIYRIAREEPHNHKAEQIKGKHSQPQHRQMEFSLKQFQVEEDNRKGFISQFAKVEEHPQMNTNTQTGFLEPITQQEQKLLAKSSAKRQKSPSRSNVEVEHSQTQKVNPIKSSVPLTMPKLKSRTSTMSQVLLNKSKRAQELPISSIANDRLRQKIKRVLTLCQMGQYVFKRHYSSDGGAERFLILNKARDRIHWGDVESDIDLSSHSSSYKIDDIKGIVFGKVTETMRKECNQKLQPWKCFSFILKKRTFDIYCKEERDLLYWLPGISLCLKELNYSNLKYDVERPHPKIEHKAFNKVVFGNREIDRFYSVGRVLWRRFLMRLKSKYHTGKNEKYHKFANQNCYAVIKAASRLMNYVPKYIKYSI